ncbi:uncharacterized protein LOC141683168 isoform X1 [Apium graveolens]|uniref:uncharacterized protein LOC141683168 isoform X1 n=1 Tax=Apium graveolens TaxID=4045 RepID=UPI003D792769
MEEKYDRGLKHVAHEHLLILKENYVAKEGDVCCGCYEQIDCSKSSFVYHCPYINFTRFRRMPCRKFLLHKTCAEVPRKIEDPFNRKEILVFHLTPTVFKADSLSDFNCGLCFLKWSKFSYTNSSYNLFVCFKCAVFLFHQSKEDPLFEHPGHKHPLALIEHPSSFKCYACKVNDNTLDSSYRCTKCQFWIHKSCGDAPHTFQFVIHKHPLIFSSSLPPRHRKFAQHCKLCSNTLSLLDWLYYCGGCRYFTHFQCARSSSVFRFGGIETCPELVHLPAANDSSLNLLFEKFIEDFNTNIRGIFSPKKYLAHWAHEEHDLKLITIDELYERKHDGEVPLLCEGCVEPIQTDEGQSYYGCFPCKFFMHKVCAELHSVITDQPWPGKMLLAYKGSEPVKLFQCDGCEVLCNGISYSDGFTLLLHIGCVTLPKSIKHEAHPHRLNHIFQSDSRRANCNACGWCYRQSRYTCEKCRFNICAESIRKTRTYKHRWDPHPLDLIYDAGMVEEHEHEFDCEFCSKEINTNNWFYHCSKCDLSFHTRCILESSYSEYKNIKFAATDEIIKDNLHPHALTFVLNKKARRCKHCKNESRGKPVLQCAPCNSTILCYRHGGWCGLVDNLVLHSRNKKARPSQL